MAGALVIPPRPEGTGIDGGLLELFIKPMGVTAKTMWRTWKFGAARPRTNLYPIEKPDMPEYYRGFHEIDWELCIGCSVCARVCPNDCIQMEKVDLTASDEIDKLYSRSFMDSKKGVAKRPGVDMGHCLLCGFCEEYCPTDAWRMVNKFELADTERDRLYYSAAALRKDEPRAPPRLLNKAMENPQLDWANCTGCQACVRHCPTRCIYTVEAGANEKGRKIRKVVFDYAICIGCRTCVEACKFDALEMNNQEAVTNPVEAEPWVRAFNIEEGTLRLQPNMPKFQKVNPVGAPQEQPLSGPLEP